MNKLKLLHVSPSFYPATYWGGPLYSAHKLCDSLASSFEIELRVLTTDSNGPSRTQRLRVDAFPVRTLSGYDIYYCRRQCRLSVSPGLFLRLLSMVRWAGVVHLTAVYSAPTIPTLLLCKVLNKPVVWSPRGALQRWEGSSRPLLKRFWEMICNYLCDEGRVTLHVTSEREKLESLGRIGRASAVVIPNGVDPVAWETHRRREHAKSLRLLYLGRLDRIKGIENLLVALKESDASVTLSICGEGGNGYAGNLKALTHKLGVSDRVMFQGHVTGEEKKRCFANSDVFVMPSFSESFGLAAAEALSHGLPVIVSKGTPWSEVERVGCGLWVDNSPQSLADAINRMRQMPLEEMGGRGQEWMAREFSWGAIAGRMFKVYEALLRSEDFGKSLPRLANSK